MSSAETAAQPGKTGLWLAILGALLILIDGIAVLATKKFYGWHIASATATGWTEIILGIIIWDS
ncbi:MAG: hypothetical protein F7C35_07535 [Desulfurococcales archaeon]|nr:hypothetical protein [Desulfurococcales archaeon]